MRAALLGSLWLLLWLAVPGQDARAKPGPTWEADPVGDRLEVALLTVGPGEVYWQRFGHNAIWIRDHADGSEVLYNYGIFDFAEADFFLNFIRGRMRYQMVGRRPSDDIGEYLAEDRRVSLQILNLSPQQRVALRDALRTNALPGNARYAYDYFLSNCSTKVRDALDAALDGALKAATSGRSRGATFRMQARRLTAPDPLVYLGIHAGLGPFTDRAVDYWDEMFVPGELERQVRALRIRDSAGTEHPLVARESILHPGRVPEPSAPPEWRLRFAAAGATLAAALVWLGAGAGWRRRSFGALAGLLWIIAGVSGLVLAGLWGLTEHQSAWRNANLALFNPLALLLLPAAWRALRNRAPASPLSAWTSALIVVAGGLAWLSLVLPGFRQDLLDWIVLWLPIHVAAWWSLRPSAVVPANAG